MKILVTGTAGFIGHQVAEALLDLGHEVVGIDNFNPYYSVDLKEARHALLEGREGYTGCREDLANAERVLAIVREHKVERICHLAAQAGVRYSLEKPFEYANSNLNGFLSVLEAIRHCGIRRLVYASSSSVYGGNAKLPFSETDPVERPVSLYAATKRANELMAHTYMHLYGLQTVGLRFFTVYGPWGRPDMATWLFCEAIVRGKPIKVFNHGDMKRDFTYIDDIVKGVLAAIFAENLDPFETINLGNHNSENLMDMIGAMADALGMEPQMELLPMQPGDVPATYADIARAREKLDFRPSTPMREGVAKFVEWYRAHPEVAEAVWNGKRART